MSNNGEDLLEQIMKKSIGQRLLIAEAVCFQEGNKAKDIDAKRKLSNAAHLIREAMGRIIADELVEGSAKK